MRRMHLVPLLILVLLMLPVSVVSGESGGLQKLEYRERPFTPRPVFLPEYVGEYLSGQTAQAEEPGSEGEHKLFENVPLGWDLNTIGFLYNWVLQLPRKAPEILQYVLDQGRLFGMVGSIVLIIFIAAVLYSLIWHKRAVRAIEKELQPLWDRVHTQSRPQFLSFIKILTSALPPLALLGIFLLIPDFIHRKAPWFVLAKKLLELWAVGTLVMNFLREILTGGLLPFCPRYGRWLFRSLRLVFSYIVVGITLVLFAEAVGLPDDVDAFIRFVFSLTVVLILSSLLMQRETMLSFLPRLPYRSYMTFTRFFNKAYFPLVLLTLFAGLAWCIGYRHFSLTILTKTWAVIAAYILIMISFHLLLMHLERKSKKKENVSDEAAQFFFRSAKSSLRYGTLAFALLLILDLLGFLTPLHHVLSIPVFSVGNTAISFLLILEAGLTLFAFIYASHLLQKYLDYRIYPYTGIDTGLGYALNTFLKYSFFNIGLITSLRVIGIDLRLLLVFAGALGIGAGMGLQGITANVISGFIIIFGRKIRKGDWIKVENKVGKVTHIYLRAMKIWTRDNIEFIVPNTDLISKTVINYTLTSPIVRIYIPVGVSYDSSPLEVRRVLMQMAENFPAIMQFRKPEVRIAEFGDSSIKLELLVWIDIRQVAEKDMRSQVLFRVFEALDNAGITIPNPQLDIHIRDGSLPQAGPRTADQKDSDLRKQVS